MTARERYRGQRSLCAEELFDRVLNDSGIVFDPQTSNLRPILILHHRSKSCDRVPDCPGGGHQKQSYNELLIGPFEQLRSLQEFDSPADTILRAEGPNHSVG